MRPYIVNLPEAGESSVHDATSKLLYSLPETIEALARAMAPARADEMDFAGLTNLSTEYTATDQRSRYGDMLWEVDLRGAAKVLIVVEFQSEVDHTMPLRLLQYTGSAWLEWARVRNPGAGDRIPLVMPVLVYGGRGRWTPPTRLAELFPAAGTAWLAGQPCFEYLLLEERREGTDLPGDNLVGQLVAVARARKRAEMVRAVEALRKRIGGEGEGGALDRAVTEWLKHVITDVNAALAIELKAATTTNEVMEVIKPKGKWAVRWYEDGLDEGRAEGMERGMERGMEQQRSLVRRLARRRFGADIADRIVPMLDRLSDPERITAIADAIVDCETADEFIARTVNS